MDRTIAGAIAGILLLGGGLFVWQATSQDADPLAAAPPAERSTPTLPDPPAADAPSRGSAPPSPPEAKKATREEARFNRYDRNRDEAISRIELMSSRTSAFKKLDKDGNNLLTFEEWAVATSDRFAGADANRNGLLTRAEFATTAPKRSAQPKCRC